jgi:hypothetical protein
MARLTDDDRENILADWHTGQFSVRELAIRHKIGKTTVANLVQGIEPKHKDKVDALVSVKTALAQESGQEVDSVNRVVDEKTKHLQFLHNATLKNISVMAKKLNEDASVKDHLDAQNAIHKAGQTLGVIEQFAKSGDVNVNTQQNVAIQTITRRVIE